MELICLGSGSKGNCYILQNDAEALIIEAGIRFDDIKKGFNFQMWKIVGAVITHQHKDHSLSIGGLLSFGIHTYAPQEVHPESHHFFHPMVREQFYKIGGFKVMALQAKHDVQCFAYVIEHPDMGRLLFVTDSVSFDYLVPKCNHIMIEANYCDTILEENIQQGIEVASLRGRLLASHMELHETKRILQAHDLTNCNEIVLVHLSSRNADALEFKETIEKATGKPTYCACKGFRMYINKFGIVD